MSVDVTRITAIDVHTHVHRSVRAAPDETASGNEAMGAYFGIGSMPHYTVPELADYYRQRNMACVAFTIDSISRPATSRYRTTSRSPSSPPSTPTWSSRSRASTRPAARPGCAWPGAWSTDFGVRGFKFHPSMQGFYPNDRMAYPLYEVIASRGLVALFHTGQTGAGAGTPGGGGIRLKYANPLYLDDVAVDFPDLDIILAHPSFPWQDEALSVATHKPRVYIDLSGWSPKYFPPLLVRYANTLLREKVLFGSDFPAITPDRWIKDFENLDIKPEVRPLIMKENAARLLRLRS